MLEALTLFLAVTTASPVASAPVAPAPPAVRVAAGKAKVFLTVEEALALVFRDCEVARRTVYLTEEQKEMVERLAGSEVERGIVHPYVGLRDGRVVAVAYFDTHRVRSLRETLMIVLTPEGTVKRLEVLAFAEPQDYLPSGKWYGQFLGRRLDDDLKLNRGIRGVTGATLTARATTEAVRRSLALHEILGEDPGEPQGSTGRGGKAR